MLTVICGEDQQTARKYLLSIKDSYKKKGYSLMEVLAADLPEVYKNSSGVVDLFGQKSVYFVDGLSKQYKGRTKTPFKQTVEALSKDKNIHLIDWEAGKSGYVLSTLKKISYSFQEYKPGKNVFQLLDFCYPGNLKNFLLTLAIVLNTQEEMFVYTLLTRQIKKLLMASDGHFDSKTAPWQRGKLQSQARMWKLKQLVNFYDGLIRIDVATKSGSSRFTIRDSIEILACYYLK